MDFKKNIHRISSQLILINLNLILELPLKLKELVSNTIVELNENISSGKLSSDVFMLRHPIEWFLNSEKDVNNTEDFCNQLKKLMQVVLEMESKISELNKRISSF